MNENLESLRAMRDNMRSGGHHAAQHAIDAAIADIERLTADLDVIKQNYVHACECIWNKNRMIADRDAEIDRLQRMATAETERCMELEAIAERLPKDAEGNPLFVGRLFSCLRSGLVAPTVYRNKLVEKD